MTNKQPEVLRLAEALIKHLGGNTANQAAAELRRLHEVNAELVEALTTILNISLMDKGHWAKTIETEAHTALAKAQGENNDVPML